jgi:hypothetical protein
MSTLAIDPHHARAAIASDPGRLPLIVAAAFLCLHVLLLLFVDASSSDVFLRADRAHVRLRTLQELLATTSAGEARQYLANHGILGDYAAHALLYALGGRFTVIAVQIALALFSGLCVYRIGRVLELSPRMCALAMALYLAMPHTLVFPHQLASEALHVPLFVISTWLIAKALRERSSRALIASAVLLGIATLIRPITLLWPIVAGIVLMIGLRPRHGLMFVGVALLPVLAWMSFVGVHTGEFGLGKSNHSMGRNLYERVGRIAATLPAEQQRQARAQYLDTVEPTLGPVEYLSFSLAYPKAALRHLMHDATAFFAKSGVERITIDYLQMRPRAGSIQDSDNGWRQQLERHGWPYTIRYLWNELGVVLVISLLGAVAIALLFAFAAIGTLHVVRRWFVDRTPDALIGVMLAGVVAYIFFFSQVLNAMQSRQRAPAEFAVVLLAVSGLVVARKWLGQRAVSSRSSVPKPRLNPAA